MKVIAFLEALLAFTKRHRRYLLMPVAIFCLYMVLTDAKPAQFWIMCWGFAFSFSFGDVFNR